MRAGDAMLKSIGGGGREGSSQRRARETKRPLVRHWLTALSGPTYGVPLTASHAPRSSPVMTEPPAPGRSPVTAVAEITPDDGMRASCATTAGASQKPLYCVRPM